MLTHPLNTWLLSSQNYFIFLSRMTKGKSLRSCHVLITRGASILILIIIIITETIISILVLKSLWRRRGRWRRGEATHTSLSSCDTTNMSVHLIQLSSECIMVSIHVLKLRHDGLKHHTTTRRRGRRGGWNGRGWRSRCLSSWPLQLKLGLALSNRWCVNGTHDDKERSIRDRDRKMTNDLRDSRREKELITVVISL